MILGYCIGAASGGKFIKIGRRKMIIIACLLGMVSTVVTLFQGLIFLLSGRLTLGISCGFLTVAVPRCVEEYTPSHLYSTISPFFCAASALGTLISYFLALLLPPDSAPKAELANSDAWRYLFGFPIIVQVCLILH